MTDLEARQQRLGANQALFRTINSNVAKLNQNFEGFALGSTFVCECASTECTEEVELSEGEYERIRADPRWFFVAASDDHVFPEVEVVVERHDRYYVVEKIEVGAEIAKATASA